MVNVRVFIGYKYTKTEDKKWLQMLLERIGVVLKQHGHGTFILHRDYLGWGNAHRSKWKQGWQIVKNIWGSDAVLMVVPHEEKSLGLELENLIAKVLGKKKVILAKNGVKAANYRSFDNTFKQFGSDEEVEELVRKIFPKK